jgi:UDP-2,3-diacylglucosamine pyrophosphatase LpxH
VILLVFFFVGMLFIILKAKYDNLASDYLQSAYKVGKYYALSCQQKEEECRQLLQQIVESSAKTHWIEGLYRDHMLQQKYNQIVLMSFEKEVDLRNNENQKK